MARRRPVFVLFVGSSLILTADCCLRKAATMPAQPPEPTEPSAVGLNSTSSVRLPCTDMEQFNAACVNGQCRSVVVQMRPTPIRSYFCDCDAMYSGARCNLPVLSLTDSTAPVNIAAGVLIGALLLVLLLVGVVVYTRSRRKSRGIMSQQNGRREEEGEELRNMLPAQRRASLVLPQAPLAEAETLGRDASDKVQLVAVAMRNREPKVLQVDERTNNNRAPPPPPLRAVAASANVRDSGVPTPLLQDFQQFGFGRDGKSLRNHEHGLKN